MVSAVLEVVPGPRRRAVAELHYGMAWPDRSPRGEKPPLARKYGHSPRSRNQSQMAASTI